MEDKKDFPDHNLMNEKKKKMNEINKEIQDLKMMDTKPVQVEFRELRHPNKKQA